MSELDGLNLGVAAHFRADLLLGGVDMLEVASDELLGLVCFNHSTIFAFGDFGKICLFNNFVVKGLGENHVDLGGHLSSLNLSGPHLKGFISFILEEDAVGDTSHSGNSSKEFHSDLIYF